MIKTTLVISETTEENASKSWEEDTTILIKKYPYHATLAKLGGGYFKNIPTIADINPGYTKSHPFIKYPLDYTINKLGEWEIEMYTTKEATTLGLIK